jgi:hypothetical protein
MGAYEIVMAVILLFPWSLAAVMIGGSAWQGVQGRLRSRHTRRRAALGSRGASPASLRPEGPTMAQAAACR